MSSRSPYTIQFWMLCVSSLLFFASFNMLIPELPFVLTRMNGADYKGLIISLFTLTAMLSRPFSGKLADNIGRIPVMMFGAIVCAVCSLIYPIVTGLFGFFFLRFIHGFSTGFTPTGHSAYISDIVNENRRGEAMGYIGTAGMLGMASGPAIGGWVSRNYGLDFMFYLSSMFGLVSVLIVAGLGEKLKNKKPFKLSLFAVKKEDLFEPRVLMPCLIMVLSMYAYGAVLTLIPDFGEHVGIQRKELLFTFFTIASLLIRLIAGKASDRYGRVPVLTVSTALVFISMATMALAETQTMLIIGVSLYGLAQGATSPTILAWATDLSESTHRGRALASVYIFMELGIGLGAAVSGWLFAQSWSGFFFPFVASGIFGLAAFFLLVFRPVKLKTRHAHE